MIAADFYVLKEGTADDGHRTFVLREVGSEKEPTARRVKVSRLTADDAAAFAPGRKFRVTLSPLD